MEIHCNHSRQWTEWINYLRQRDLIRQTTHLAVCSIHIQVMFRCFDKLYFVWIYCIKSSDLNLPLIQWKKYIYTAHMVCYSLQAWWNHQFPLPPGCLHLQCPVNTIQLSSRTAHTHKGNNLHQTETVWHGLFSLWNQHKEIVNVQLLQLTCMMMNHKRPLFVFLKLSDSPSKKKTF